MTHQEFQEVAKQAFPQEPHMQDCIEPKWLSRLIQDDLQTQRPNPESISVEFVSDGCVAVMVDGQKVGEYSPTYKDGQYVGHTIK